MKGDKAVEVAKEASYAVLFLNARKYYGYRRVFIKRDI